MKPDPFLTRLYHRLPASVKRNLLRPIRRWDIGLALKFYFGEDSVLREKGWLESERRGIPVDGDGNPIPWYTYGALEFLDDRLNDELRVFEYGGGNSTRWYADRVDEVIAVESSEDWVEKIQPELPDNSRIIHQPSTDQYISQVERSGEFDVIVIDGKHRSDCLEHSMASLTKRGVIIRDDYQRVNGRQDPAVKPLFDAGYRVHPFWGLKSLNSHYRCTAVFYRDENCFDI